MATCALCAGDLETVVEVLEDQIARFDGVGALLEQPLGVAPDLIEAYLGPAATQTPARSAARFPGPRRLPLPQVAAMVARCDALIATDTAVAESSFELSLALFDARTDPLESARTRLLLGMRLRRAGRRVDARVHLEAARRQFAAMDLTLSAGRAQGQLAATGERVQSRGAPLGSR